MHLTATATKSGSSLDDRATFDELRKLEPTFDEKFKIEKVVDAAGKALDYTVNKTMRIDLARPLKPGTIQVQH